MTQRTATIDKLVVYFNEIGQVLKPHEYRLRTDTPIRYARIRSIFGSWNRMENIVRKHNARNEKPADYVPATDVDEVLAAAFAAQAPKALATEEEKAPVATPKPKGDVKPAKE
jgi:hypothetical protein